MFPSKCTWRRLSTVVTPIDLSISQKLFLVGASSIFGILNTHRGDLISNIAETSTPGFILNSLQNKMLESDSGVKLLREKPDVNTSTINFERLKSLPSNTFGNAYYRYMSSHDYSPNERTPVRFISNPDHAFIMLRYRQTHDFLHSLSGLPPTVLGELSQKVFEFLHYGLPMCLIAALAGPLRLTMRERILLATEHVPWSIECNRNVKTFLLSVPFEEHFEEDLDEFRNRLGFIRAPELDNEPKNALSSDFSKAQS